MGLMATTKIMAMFITASLVPLVWYFRIIPTNLKDYFQPAPLNTDDQTAITPFTWSGFTIENAQKEIGAVSLRKLCVALKREKRELDTWNRTLIVSAASMPPRKGKNYMSGSA